MESRKVFISLIKRRMEFEEVFGILMLNLHSQGFIKPSNWNILSKRIRKVGTTYRDSVVVIVV